MYTTQSVQHMQRKKLGTNFLPISVFHTFYPVSILLMGLSQSVICVDNAVRTISRQIYHNRSNLQIFEQGRVGVIVAPCIGVIVAHRTVYYYQFWSIPIGRIILVFWFQMHCILPTIHSITIWKSHHCVILIFSDPFKIKNFVSQYFVNITYWDDRGAHSKTFDTEIFKIGSLVVEIFEIIKISIFWDFQIFLQILMLNRWGS